MGQGCGCGRGMSKVRNVENGFHKTLNQIVNRNFVGSNSNVNETALLIITVVSFL